MEKIIKNAAAIVLVAIVFCAITTVVYAGEGGGPAQATDSQTVWALFKSTGLVGIILLCCSIAGTAFVIQNFVNVKEEKLIPPELVTQVEDLLAAQEIEHAYELCAANNNYFCNIVGGGLERTFAGYDEIRAGMAESSSAEKFKLDSKISYLSLIGNLGPLIGLLGTVTGMVSSFQIIERLPAPTPANLAKGVYEALVNTTMGLFTAIIFLTFNFYFKNKISELTLKINTIATDILSRTISPEARQDTGESRWVLKY